MGMPARPPAGPARPSLQSLVGLNAANFFLAEVTGVVMPFLGTFLAERGWKPDGVGVVLALGGLGVFLAQTPAGLLTDRLPWRRTLLAVASLVVGLAYGVLPLLPATPETVGGLVFTAGVAQAFFAPALAALALGLVGHAGLGRVVGTNQGFNHAGNLAAALLALLLVGTFGIPSVFYTILVVSAVATASLFLIRGADLDERQARGGGETGWPVTALRELLADGRVRALVVAVALFHLANAPVMPLVGLYVHHLGGRDQLVAAVVLVAQLVMVPVSLLAGRLCDTWGRKPVFAVGFLALPVRIALYARTTNPAALVALQTLDGIGAGIYGVAVVAMGADLTRGKATFATLQGVLATALSVGGVAGPLLAGLLARHLGYPAAFLTFAGIAAAGAAVFLLFVPETRAEEREEVALALRASAAGAP